jgi:hypothetical protein
MTVKSIFSKPLLICLFIAHNGFVFADQRLEQVIDLPKLLITGPSSLDVWRQNFHERLNLQCNLEILIPRDIAKELKWPGLEVPRYHGPANGLSAHLLQNASKVTVKWTDTACNLTVRYNSEIISPLDEHISLNATGVWTWDGLLAKLRESAPLFTCSVGGTTDFGQSVEQNLRKGQTIRDALNDRAARSGAKWTTTIFDKPGSPFPMLGEDFNLPFRAAVWVVPAR